MMVMGAIYAVKQRVKLSSAYVNHIIFSVTAGGKKALRLGQGFRSTNLKKNIKMIGREAVVMCKTLTAASEYAPFAAFIRLYRRHRNTKKTEIHT